METFRIVNSAAAVLLTPVMMYFVWRDFRRVNLLLTAIVLLWGLSALLDNAKNIAEAFV